MGTTNFQRRGTRALFPGTVGRVFLPTFAVLLLVALLPGAALAERSQEGGEAKGAEEDSGLYAYVDDEGRLHVVGSPDLVPARYRSRAQPASLDSASGIQVTGGRAGRRPSGDRSRRRRAQRAAPRATGSGDAEAADKPTQATPAERLQKLQQERARAIDELGGLSEGWLDDEAGKEAAEGPTVEELERLADDLARRIEELDRRIRELD